MDKAPRNDGKVFSRSRHSAADTVQRTGPPFSLRILILEDAAPDAELILYELRKAGWKPEWHRVHTRHAFIEHLDTVPDIILADYAVPGFGARQALELLHERGLSIPLIVVTGSITDEAAVECMRLGAADYLLKDRLARLPEAVAQALAKQRVRAENEQADRALRESERLKDAVIRSALDCVITIDKEGRILEFNPAAERTFGYKRADIMGKTMTDLLIPTQFREAHRRGFAHLLATGEGPIMGKRVELTALRSDGSEFPIELAVSAAGSWTAPILTAYIRDISERRSAEDRIRRLNRVYAVLSGINTLIVRVRDRETLFREACRIAVEHGNFKIAWIGLCEPTTREIKPVAVAGIEDAVFLGQQSSSRTDMPGETLKGRALREKAPVFNNDIAANPSIGGSRRKAALKHGLRSVISLPLIIEAEALGTLTLYAKEPQFFNEEEVRLLTELAGDISFALEGLARQAKLEKLARIRAVSSAVNAAIVRVRSGPLLLAESCRIAQEHGKFEMVWVGSLDHEKQEIYPVAWAGFSEAAAKAVSWTSIGATQGTLGEAIRTRLPAVRDDIKTQLPAGKLRQEALDRGCRSTVCVPVTMEDSVVALFVLFAPGIGFFDQDEMALLNEMAADISLALQSIRRQERLSYIAYHDELTGLPNRLFFTERLKQALLVARQEGRQMALVLSDVRRLRHVNESYGRRAGDTLLKEIAARWKRVWPNPDHVARIAADCLAGFVEGVGEPAQLLHLLEGPLQDSITAPIPLEGKELGVSLTSGIAIYPTDGEDAETLLRNADAALNKARKDAAHHLFYQATMNSVAADALLLENRMRRAVEKEQFVLHYQPKVNAVTRAVSGVEALIRWIEPGGNLVSPAQFIPLLEDTGMILQVGRWAIQQALRDYREWQGQMANPPKIAVNVSTIQLRQRDFVQVVRAAIAESGITAACLDLEITESMLMDDIDGNIAKLSAIRDMGVSISIDDFGTGYSSLGYLAKLPVNALKIDRSFIMTMAEHPDSMSIVSTVISLAHALNLKVIAEGVESEAQARLLQLLRCDELQGYLVGKPMPADQLRVILQTNG